MTREQHDRLKALYRRFDDRPESSIGPEGATLRRDAYVAFLDARKMIGDEILPLAFNLSVPDAPPACPLCWLEGEHGTLETFESADGNRAIGCTRCHWMAEHAAED
ncbi:hypothetical protein [Croceibacterium aestuarii]|uniref:hypothetical protein n=1 Tax=Croceibacterium aestuarii TaxID=3064139 RepID=UPI00272E23AF|nr:hypothetical protein [Croceibacterium sp. D39]